MSSDEQTLVEVCASQREKRTLSIFIAPSRSPSDAKFVYTIFLQDVAFFCFLSTITFSLFSCYFKFHFEQNEKTKKEETQHIRVFRASDT